MTIGDGVAKFGGGVAKFGGGCDGFGDGAAIEGGVIGTTCGDEVTTGVGWAAGSVFKPLRLGIRRIGRTGVGGCIDIAWFGGACSTIAGTDGEGAFSCGYGCCGKAGDGLYGGGGAALECLLSRPGFGSDARGNVLCR